MKAASRLRLLAAVAATLMLSTLTATTASAQTITRGPYLQMPGPDRMTVVFHTDIALTSAEVDYGTTVGLGTVMSGSSSADLMGGFKHVVNLAGLTDYTKYFYAVGDNGTPITTAGNDYAFTTSPLPGTRQPIRIWTFGDSGYWPGKDAATHYQQNREEYYEYVGAPLDANGAADATDVMLYLGDNAYTLGDDPTHQAVFFGPPELQAFLRRQPFLSAIGNHEGFVADSVTETGDYYDMFYFPTGNELGSNGVASGSESYFSFDYGNIHFIVLDTEENVEDLGGVGAAMLTWLENDLLATTADWIIAAWHRPPYSKGLFHDSDTEGNEVLARENFLPILEDYGVDLVVNGHSHSYERTPLIDDHIGMSGTLDAAHILDGGDGDPNGDGPYRKASLQQAPHEGAVYVVTGAAADARAFNPAEGHPLMVNTNITPGTSIIEVDGDTLTGKYLTKFGSTSDTFRIEKGISSDCPVAPLGGCASAGKAKIVIKDNADDAKDSALWKWSKIPLDYNVAPTNGTDLIACTYDATGNVHQLTSPNLQAYSDYTTVSPAPSGAWTSKKLGLHLYKDKEASISGLLKGKTKSKGTDPKGSAQFKTKGAGTAPPALPLTGPAQIQLINLDTGECWDSTLTEKKNDGTKYIAVGP
jgi:hypothetical protein